MKFSIKNVGAIESAEIELKGLTVITGLNDIGKSVLSKSIFSTIKTIYRANELAIDERNISLQNILQQIISLGRQYVKFPMNENIDSQGYIINSVNRILALVRENSAVNIEEAQLLNADLRKNVLESIEINQTVTSKTALKSFSVLFDSAAKLIVHEPMNEEKYKTFFNDVVIRSIFQGQFNSKIEPSKPAIINVTEGDVQLLNLVVEKERTTNFEVVSDFLYNEATLIESPYVVQLSDFTNLALAYLPYQIKSVKQSNLPYHVRDISLKIRTGYGSMTSGTQNVFEKVSSQIGGNVHYDAQENTIVFEKNNGDKIKSYNIASGVKSFGLLQMFLSSGLGNSRSLLIIDEPEVHLHLKWQLLYAEIICELVNDGIPIIISTHSPFFLEALSLYVKKFKLEDSVTVYNGTKNDKDRTVFKEIPKDDLSEIFEHLAEPMVTLQMLN